MARKIRVVVLNVKENKVETKIIDSTLDAWYSEIGCQLVEIQRRKIGRKCFDVICDEEGLYADDPKISAIDNMGKAMFVGNLIIADNNGAGGMIGLSEKDCVYVTQRVQSMATQKHPEGYLMLTQCEYDL